MAAVPRSRSPGHAILAAMQDGGGMAAFTGQGSSAMGGTRRVVVHAVAAVKAGQRIALCGAPLTDVDRDGPWRRENADFACGRCVAAPHG